MDALFDALTALVGLAVLAFVAWLAFGGAWAKRRKGMVTVYDYEAGLKFERGKLVETLPPGRYATWPAPVEIERVDLREQSITVAGQEILTQDNLPVRVSALVRWKVADAPAFKRAGANVYARLHEATQLVLRRRIGRHALDALLAERAVLDEGFAAELAAEIPDWGVAVLGAAVRDLNLVGPAKQAYADLWRAQKEGLAALERARGEQAALRALANAARMLKGNPELMNLRLLAALQGQPGKAAPTVVLGGAGGLLPVSKDAAPDE
ncbi:MAG: slipin family protein [Hyphomonadaceae bacterium]|nr:slipin family protein [Hyphomonadaceae bacterium]